MRKLLVATSVLFLCGAANVALAGELTGNDDMRSKAEAVVSWQHDQTLLTHRQSATLSAQPTHVGAMADGAVIVVGSHALSAQSGSNTLTGTDADMLSLATMGASPGVAANLGVSHSFGSLPLPSDSSRILPLQ